MDGTDFGVRDSGPQPGSATSLVTASPVAVPEVPAAGRHTPGPARQGLIALAIYIGVFVVAFGLALIGRMAVPQVGQVYVDPQIFIWSWRWWPYAITHGINPLYTTAIGAPAGYNLAAWPPSAPSVALLMWPVTALWGSVVSFNVTLLLAPPTAAWAAFVLARRLTKRFWASLLAGAVYGFNLYELSHNESGQANVSATLLLPLIVYLVLRWWDGTLGRRSFVIWMAVALAAEFYTFSEGFLDVTIVGVIALVIGLAFAGPGARRTVARLAGLTALGYAGALLLASPYLFDELRNMSRGLDRNAPAFELHLSALIVPSPDRLWELPALASFSRANPGADYVGIPLLVLLIVFAVRTWSSRITRLLVTMFAVVIVLAVGSTLVLAREPDFALPWGAVWNLPVVRGVETDRFILFGFLVLAIVVALWLAAPARNRLVWVARWGLAMLALAAMFANLPTLADAVVPPVTFTPAVASLKPSDQLPSFVTDGSYERYLTRGEIVVVVSDRGNAGMLFQAETDFYFRVAGGYIDSSLNPFDAIPEQVELLSHPTPARVRGFEAYLKTAGIGAIIVERAWSQRWMYVFGQLGMRATTVGGVTIFRPVPAKTAARTASLR